MRKILIVEDDPINMFLYRKMLESEGYNILMSSTGEDAIDIARKYHPDVVLLDVFLPNRSGFDIYEDMQNDADLRDVPVVFASASFDNDFVVERTGISRECVMRKPIIFQNLTNLMNKLTEGLTNKIVSYA